MRGFLDGTEGVGVVGLGYVGLPLAVAFAEAGLTVVGVDSNSKKIAVLESGGSYVEDVPPELVRALISSKELRVTEDYAALAKVGAVVICLPTDLDENREPDLSAVRSGAREIARHLRPGALVVLSSTSYPGTTRELLLPILEGGGESMTVDPVRRLGRDFHLAFSPERVDPGNRRYTLRNTPRVVGGLTSECTRRTEMLFGRVTEEIHIVSSPECAEMSKLLENTFRGVNVALVNELAILCERMGLDVWEAVEAAATKPFGFMPFYPGPGLGGHCIPVDPFYLAWRARAFDTSMEFIERAGRLNVGMPYYAFGRITAALNAQRKPVNGSRILLLGVAYKPNVGDVRESPSLKILNLLKGAGARVVYHDPHLPHLPEHGLSSVELSQERLAQTDCTVIATDHDVVDLRPVVDSVPLVMDLRNAVRRRLGKLPANVNVI